MAKYDSDARAREQMRHAALDSFKLLVQFLKRHFCLPLFCAAIALSGAGWAMAEIEHDICMENRYAMGVYKRPARGDGVTSRSPTELIFLGQMYLLPVLIPAFSRRNLSLGIPIVIALLINFGIGLHEFIPAYTNNRSRACGGEAPAVYWLLGGLGLLLPYVLVVFATIKASFLLFRRLWNRHSK